MHTNAKIRNFQITLPGRTAGYRFAAGSLIQALRIRAFFQTQHNAELQLVELF